MICIPHALFFEVNFLLTIIILYFQMKLWKGVVANPEVITKIKVVTI